jgi:glyoxylase I family protein
MFGQGIPLAAFEVSDIQADFARQRNLGVVFTKEPTRSGPVIIAVLADTCGNLIELYQPA